MTGNRRRWRSRALAVERDLESRAYTPRTRSPRNEIIRSTVEEGAALRFKEQRGDKPRTLLPVERCVGEPWNEITRSMSKEARVALPRPWNAALIGEDWADVLFLKKTEGG
jgi:hypothetical protein